MRNARRTAVVSLLPLTAAMGLTLAARFAGACAASSTVMMPTAAPLASPTGLSSNTGMAANSPPMP